MVAILTFLSYHLQTLYLGGGGWGSSGKIPQGPDCLRYGTVYSMVSVVHRVPKICLLFEWLLRSSNISSFSLFKIFDERNFNLRLALSLSKSDQWLLIYGARKSELLVASKPEDSYFP